MIKLKCQDCDYCYEVSEKELLDNGDYHSSCLVCGGQMIVANMDELLEKDIEQQADVYLQQWFKERGLEGTVQLIENSPRNGVRDLYMRKLKERGLIK